jgi:two-component system sensor histidine kinase/response regulator
MLFLDGLKNPSTKKKTMSNNSDSLILIVDDNANNLKLLGSIFSVKGFKVGLATNGQECFDFIEKQVPDLIFLDIMMPDINGFDVCVRLKGDEKTKLVPVIFISALSNPIQIVKAFESGGNDYVTKPFNKDEVLSRAILQLNAKHEKEMMLRKIEELNEKISELENPSQ